MILLAVAGVLSVGEGSRIYLKAILAQILLQNAWSQTKNGQSQVKPWPWADTHPVARLEVAALDADMIVLAGSTGATLAFGPGHMLSSAKPGDDDNMVIVGHRDTHFQFLQHLALGEVVHMQLPDGREYDYEVMAIDVVDSRRGQLVLDTAEAMMSLVTCYPFDGIETGGPLRYVVSARMMR